MEPKAGPENFKGGSVRRKKRKRKGHRFQRPPAAPAERSEGYKPPEGSPEFFSRCTAVLRGLQPSEARPSRRAKRGSTERSEAPPSKARLYRAKRGSIERRGRAKVIGRSPLQKNSKRFHQKAQGEPLIQQPYSQVTSFFFFFLIYPTQDGITSSC